MISNTELHDSVIEDLISHYNQSPETAEAWFLEHAENILDDMYDAYTDYLSEYGDK
jgi:hypothetical protein